MNAASEALGSGLFIAVVRVLPRKSDNSYFNPTISYFFLRSRGQLSVLWGRFPRYSRPKGILFVPEYLSLGQRNVIKVTRGRLIPSQHLYPKNFMREVQYPFIVLKLFFPYPVARARFYHSFSKPLHFIRLFLTPCRSDKHVMRP